MKTHFCQRQLSLPTWKNYLQNEATWGKRREEEGEITKDRKGRRNVGKEEEEKGRTKR